MLRHLGVAFFPPLSPAVRLPCLAGWHGFGGAGARWGMLTTGIFRVVMARALAQGSNASASRPEHFDAALACGACRTTLAQRLSMQRTTVVHAERANGPRYNSHLLACA